MGGNTCREDEAMIATIRESNLFSHAGSGAQLLLADCRPKVNAMANKAGGGGYEVYHGTQLQFLNIANIHAVRDAHRAVEKLCQSAQPRDATWTAAVVETQWLTHLRAVQRFGRDTAARAGAITIPVQNVGVEDDHAASAPAIADVGWALPPGTTCFFENEVNHSLLSRFDSPDEDKYWIPATLEQLVRFANDATPFDQSWSGTVEGYPRCRSR
jgi:hypothetical protein